MSFTVITPYPGESLAFEDPNAGEVILSDGGIYKWSFN